MYRKIILLFVLSISIVGHSQMVTTVTDGDFTDALAIDSQGNIYGSDWTGNTVYKYDTSNNVTVFKNGFSNPNGIAINSLDEIYVCDHTANSIFKYDTSGTLLASYTTGLTTPAGIKNIPNTTDMLVVEYGNFASSSKIKKLEANGSITTLFDGFPLNGPAGIAFINDIPYIANYNDRKIFKLENGTLTLIAQLAAGAPNSNLLGFLGALDNQLIATQIGENKIYVINPNDGTITLYAGSNNGNADGDLNTATFSAPNGILGDDANNRIYISDFTSKNLRIINNASLSINEFTKEVFEIKLFPNPTSDSLNIKIDNLKGNTLFISLIDNLGKEVFKKTYTHKNPTFNTSIDTKSFASGLYTITITAEKEKVTRKVIF